MTVGSKRTIWLGAAHAALCALALWSYYPRPDGNERIVEGFPSEYKTCGSKSCDTGIKVGDVILSCSVEPLGLSYSCANFYSISAVAKATYFITPTFMSSIGISRETAVILQFEQSNQVLRTYERDRMVRSYFIGALLPTLFFVISFLQFRKLRYFKQGD